MAGQGSQLQALDRLIEAFIPSKSEIVGFDPSRVRRTINSILKNSRVDRTNQFAVYDHYAGLQERARIVSYPELANALETAWTKIGACQDKWTPEKLSFVIQLADDPINKTSLEDLLHIGRPPSPPLLTWNDILKDDPIDDADESIWQSVDFGEESSVEGSETDSDDFASAQGSISSTGKPQKAGDYDYLPDELKLAVNLETSPSIALRPVSVTSDESVEDQFPASLTEARLVRETLFMLQGLPCDAYTETSDGHIEFQSRIALEDVSNRALQSLCGESATIATEVLLVRKWLSSRQNVPLVQAFQASLSTKLTEIRFRLSELEQQIISGKGRPLTMLSMKSEVQKIFKDFLPLCKIVKSHMEKSEQQPFLIIESLFELVCDYEAIGESKSCRNTIRTFGSVFQIYTRPLKLWMTQGIVEARDSTLFISESKVSQPLERLWSDKFSVREVNGQVSAPRFLHLSVERIFATGKAVCFLNALGDGTLFQEESDFTFDDSEIFSTQGSLGLLPFQEVFNSKFESWITSLHRSSARKIMDTLNDRCGLQAYLDSLEYIYFRRDGSVSDQAMRSLYEAIDTHYRGWNNAYILTDLTRDVFEEIESVDTSRLSIKPFDADQIAILSKKSIHAFEAIEVIYSLPWALANVVQPSSLSVYQNVFTLLMQIQRAKSLLDEQSLRVGRSDKRSVNIMNVLLSYLRYHLRWYIDTLQTFFATMLPLSCQKMRQEMGAAEDIDGMIAAHARFVELIALRSISGSAVSSVRQALVSLLDLAVVFSDVCYKVQHEEATESEISSLEKMVNTFDRLLAFVLAGVQRIGRTNGDDYLGMLAENLAFGIKMGERT